ncbi:hypothetical protein EH240_29225 [Mesorhizobium tamadayense]|uniref:Uncharacterized protein n=1 Tax=Mesorhizobium tamadayense TaxID=425306 RepID=A0A3P3F7B4_9HYPH|nr:hypothetical protein [Mesorhizobium tamadayense]RRH93508.1 hypothetical protein EH240_29225 [Mesorhizobium tamadayense]
MSGFRLDAFAGVSFRAPSGYRSRIPPRKPEPSFETWFFSQRLAVSRFFYLQRQIVWRQATVLLLKDNAPMLAATLRKLNRNAVPGCNS